MNRLYWLKAHQRFFDEMHNTIIIQCDIQNPCLFPKFIYADWNVRKGKPFISISVVYLLRTVMYVYAFSSRYTTPEHITNRQHRHDVYWLLCTTADAFTHWSIDKRCLALCLLEFWWERREKRRWHTFQYPFQSMCKDTNDNRTITGLKSNKLKSYTHNGCWCLFQVYARGSNKQKW